MHENFPGRSAETIGFSLILPTYNAAAQLAGTWSQLQSLLTNPRDLWEVIFVCDGCSDGSEERLRQLTSAAGSRARRKCVRLRLGCRRR